MNHRDTGQPRNIKVEKSVVLVGLKFLVKHERGVIKNIKTQIILNFGAVHEKLLLEWTIDFWGDNIKFIQPPYNISPLA